MESVGIGRNFIRSRDRKNANIDALVEQGVVRVQGKLKGEIYIDCSPQGISHVGLLFTGTC